MAVGRPGKLGTPAVSLAAEDLKHACATVPVHRQPMEAWTAKEPVRKLRLVMTLGVQVNRNLLLLLL